MLEPTPAQLAAHDLFRISRIVPVVSVDDEEAGVALARALVAGGLKVVEMTLRSPNALNVAAAIAREVPDAVLGLGTVLEPRQIERALACGARFLVSPGVTDELAAAARACPAPFLPGVATVSEAMRLRALGFRLLKFFPAESSGGAAALKSLQPVLPDIAFCPTGGIDAAKAPAYLALPNVAGVGGSWMVPSLALQAKDWALIRKLAAEAAALAGGRVG